MNRSVLLIPAPEIATEPLCAGLRADFDVTVAESGVDALARARRGKFAVCLMAERGPRDIGAADLLAHFQESWPDIVRVWLGGDERAHSLGVFRSPDTRIEREELKRVVQLATERFDVLDTDRLMIDQLRFTRESLISMTQTLEKRLDQQMARLKGLYALALELNGADTLEEIARLAVTATSEALAMPAVIELWDGDEDRTPVEASAGGDLRFEVVATELKTTDTTIGTLSVDVGLSSGAKLSTADQRILESIASSAAIASANMIRRLERDDAQHATIVALARLAEHRDTETGKHLDRVSRFCTLIANGLRDDGVYLSEISDAFVLNLHRSAPLHDIGKVGIADSILLKPGKLTADEWTIMKTHTTIGADTLRTLIEDGTRCDYLRVGYEIAYCHHEKWDGSGYPRALMAEDIPLSARILALADCYDALTTRRPYKEPWTHEDAMAHVLSQSGSHFDPAVVEAFHKRQDEVNEIRSELADVIEGEAAEVEIHSA